ncbi:M61 family metallopeptidase [Aquimarina intermedia]|uniref:Putative metalloprotease with PDZ domain n=1 Tax=Aquimarina intermedia TaxID=350814 RepID=A0A5S5CFM1_9FLAO|nr:PDZ domain-containing protein [Aquimarina intermedia]TYP77096.1 putative metalloprotease with PDZ domain [Aquimarina intermedia]
MSSIIPIFENTSLSQFEKMKILAHFTVFFSLTSLFSQHTAYTISFENAVHHEATIEAVFTDISQDTLAVRMSRTSPGRYALHEFAKNVYDVKVENGSGEKLNYTRPNPHQWNITNHDGTVKISYTLFADRADGTYSQIDESHAHLNTPATFLYAPSYKDTPSQLQVKVRKDLEWKVATQLKKVNDSTFTAPNLQYFMDSPIEISNYMLRAFKVPAEGKEYTIKLALHHNGTQEDADTYFEKIKKIVPEQKEVFGSYPDFDYNEYTFIACYISQASGDGMEHRNSTILTNSRSLADGGMEKNIGTVSHEFFHAWNVERIRPKSLEPFNFEEANMSGELWFAEGFTSYYTNLILCRAGLMSTKDYVEGLSKSYNYVWNSPGRDFFSPIEMSFQAPFVDAAKSVDPVNRGNTFISYYSYGSMLGLALDLSLRTMDPALNLDDYMKLVWNSYGKSQTPYTVKNLKDALASYTGKAFASHFFNDFIYDSKRPDYKTLFEKVGIKLENEDLPYSGLTVKFNKEQAKLSDYVIKNSPAYRAGLEKGDVIRTIDNDTIRNKKELDNILTPYKTGDSIRINYERLGKKKQTTLHLEQNPVTAIILDEQANKEALKKRNDWLKNE